MCAKATHRRDKEYSFICYTKKLCLFIFNNVFNKHSLIIMTSNLLHFNTDITENNVKLQLE